MPTLEETLFIAVLAHEGQRDRADKPYILHPLRVMFSMETEEERIVAVLHDVVEDTEMTLDKLEDYGFSPEIIDAVKHLTKQPGEEYMDFISRVTLNPLATKIKMADLRDNMDESRIAHPTDADETPWRKYKEAYPVLVAGQYKGEA